MWWCSPSRVTFGSDLLRLGPRLRPWVRAWMRWWDPEDIQAAGLAGALHRDPRGPVLTVHAAATANSCRAVRTGITWKLTTSGPWT